MGASAEALTSEPRKLTKTVVDRLAAPDTGQRFIRDTVLKGFAVRVTAKGAKSFVVEKRISGKVRRMTLGRYPGLTVEQARIKAHQLLGQIVTGYDPIAAERESEARAVTLGDAFEAFLSHRKHLKPKTVYEYRANLTRYLGDWWDRPLLDIKKDHIAERHHRIGTENGEAAANLAMRILRAIYTFAQEQYEDRHGDPIIVTNPVQSLTRKRGWYRIERRRTWVKPHELPAWYRGVESLRGTEAGDIGADYLLLLLLTGLRRSEGASLQWANVDLQGRTLTIPDTKNAEPHTLPLSDALADLVTRRRECAWDSAYVFPGTGRTGHLVEPRPQVRRVIDASGVSFTLHDLRRTFITVADMQDIPAYAVKRLANHKMSGDVTAGYIVTDVERLRQPMQRITDYLLAAMNGPLEPRNTSSGI